MYQESGRYYHTEEHIDRCLQQLDEAAPHITDAIVRCSELAIWFHDAVYKPGAKDNEFESSQLFSQFASGVVPPAVVNQVNAAIMSTVHAELPGDEVSNLVVDVDLSGFGQQWSGFLADGENVRKENSHQSDFQYAHAQTVFMKRLLNRGKIFSTRYFYQLHEAQAQNNIKQQLEIYQTQLNQEES